MSINGTNTTKAPNKMVDFFYNLKQSKRFVLPIIDGFSVLNNFTCCIVFFIIIKNNYRNRQRGSHMYNLLFFKSISDLFYGIITLLDPTILSFKNMNGIGSFMVNFWRYLFSNCLIPTLQISSDLLEIAATIDCALSINKKFKFWFKSISFYIVLITIFILSFGIGSYYLIYWKIEHSTRFNKSLNRTITVFYVAPNFLKVNLKSYYVFNLVQSFIRDLILLLILLALNIYILVKLRQIKIRKNKLGANSTCTNTATNNRKEISKVKRNLRSNAERAELRKVIMIGVLCLIYLIGHFPTLFYSLSFFIQFKVIAGFWQYEEYFKEVLFHLSYGVSLYVYLLFNIQFKIIIERIFCCRL
jgi:hypothetical protein